MSQKRAEDLSPALGQIFCWMVAALAQLPVLSCKRATLLGGILPQDILEDALLSNANQ